MDVGADTGTVSLQVADTGTVSLRVADTGTVSLRVADTVTVSLRIFVDTGAASRVADVRAAAVSDLLIDRINSSSSSPELQS